MAIAWAGHRDLFALIRRTDRVLVWLNILYLLPLSILPFGASLLARYDEEPVALQMYGILLVAIALTRLVIWWYATGRPHLLVVPVTRGRGGRGSPSWRLPAPPMRSPSPAAKTRPPAW